VIEIDRLAFDQRCRRDQLIGGAAIESEAALDQAVQLALLALGRLAVERDHMDQKRGGRQLVAVVVEGALAISMGRHNIGNELAQSVEHRFLPVIP
jgi:hypothetical protein